MPEGTIFSTALYHSFVTNRSQNGFNIALPVMTSEI